jgi:hypothetical protein
MAKKPWCFRLDGNRVMVALDATIHAYLAVVQNAISD